MSHSVPHKAADDPLHSTPLALGMLRLVGCSLPVGGTICSLGWESGVVGWGGDGEVLG